ncbi:hypothetical protein B0H17DRAFT_1123806 [Mycena rosella]|uniref:Uncharacterized protein n=1 Tax=Mycena rosella TaxID=1033263 RepID=A0AAD7MCJ0_MYCRO|nr:hypothetical protein B0H17DRAFT_1123806 [Mycena rosella]
MPPTAPDDSTTRTTAPWFGSQPPPIPLCYSYLNSSIPRRVLQGIQRYLENYALWERPTPNDARMSWNHLRDPYQALHMAQEAWLAPVLTILNVIVTTLVRDLGLAHSRLQYDPHLFFSQHGDKDWLATAVQQPDAVQALIQVMNDAGGPQKVPVGPPSTLPQTSSPSYTTSSVPTPDIRNHLQAEGPQLDLQMQNRVIARRVSSYAPRYGIVYTGNYFLLAENVSQPFPRGPPLTLLTDGDPRVRGLGVSKIEHIVGGSDPPFRGFLALVAINAPPEMLTLRLQIPSWGSGLHCIL